MDCLFLPCICGTEPKTEAQSPPVYNCPVCQVTLHFFFLLQPDLLQLALALAFLGPCAKQLPQASC